MTLQSNFLWGGAIAANQAEGAWNVDGKGPSIGDFLTAGSVDKKRMYTPKLQSDKNYPSHEGIRFFEKYKDDIRMFSEMGFNTFRLSISWSRIFPNGDDELPNEKGLIFYEKVFDECARYGIEPIVTLSHFDMPMKLIKEYNGFYSRETIEFFKRYVTVVFNRYRKSVKYWITFNEINFGTLESGALEVLGINDKNLTSSEQARFQSLHNVFVASAEAVKIGHEINSDFKIGCMIAHVTLYPLTCNPNDILLTQKRDRTFNDFCADVQVRGQYPYYMKKYFEEKNIKISFYEDDRKILSEGCVDYYTFSYYMSNCVSAEEGHEVSAGNLLGGIRNPYLETSEWGWQIDPKGLRFTLNKIYDRYHLPMMIVENGLGAEDKVNSDGSIHDHYRIDYLRQHIIEMKHAVDEGVKLIGYTMWSPIDIVSSSTGEMKKRYGLIYVNRQDDGTGDYKRFKKDSFYWYKKVVESNGEELG